MSYNFIMESSQDLSQYIKQSLAAGVSREDIKKSLISSGWSEADVILAISSFDSSSLNKKWTGKRLLIWAIVILVLISGILGGFFLYKNKLSSKNYKADVSNARQSSSSVKYFPTTYDLFVKHKNTLGSEAENFPPALDPFWFRNYAGSDEDIQKKLAFCGGLFKHTIDVNSINPEDDSDKPSGRSYFDQMKSHIQPVKDEDGYFYAKYYEGGIISEENVCLYKSKNDGTFFTIATSSIWQLVGSLEEYKVYDRAQNKYLFCGDLPEKFARPENPLKDAVLDININGLKPNEILFALRDGCVYKSVDFGQTLSRVDASIDFTNRQRLVGYLDNSHVKKIIADPVNTNVFFIKEESIFQRWAGLGNTFKSNDGGVHFDEYPMNMDIAINPKTGIYFALEKQTDSISILRAEKSGDEWKEVYNIKGCCGEPSYYFNEKGKIYFDSLINNDVYIVANGLFRSRDDGKTWVKISDEKNTPTIISVVNGKIYGLAKNSENNFVFNVSMDGGKTWTRKVMKEFNKDSFLLSILAVSDNLILVSSNNKAIISRNGGGSWDGLNVYSPDKYAWIFDIKYNKSLDEVLMGTYAGLLNIKLSDVGASSSGQ